MRSSLLFQLRSLLLKSFVELLADRVGTNGSFFRTTVAFTLSEWHLLAGGFWGDSLLGPLRARRHLRVFLSSLWFRGRFRGQESTRCLF
jgi:hypothetical protein